MYANYTFLGRRINKKSSNVTYEMAHTHIDLLQMKSYGTNIHSNANKVIFHFMNSSLVISTKFLEVGESFNETFYFMKHFEFNEKKTFRQN